MEKEGQALMPVRSLSPKTSTSPREMRKGMQEKFQEVAGDDAAEKYNKAKYGVSKEER